MCGAGVLDARSALYTINNTRYLSASYAANTAVGIRRYYNFSVTSSDSKIRVSLSWLKHSSLSGDHAAATPTDYTLADLDLTIYDPSGNFVTCSVSTVNNTEIVEFVPTITGSYQIMVTVCKTSPKAIYYGLAWW